MISTDRIQDLLTGGGNVLDDSGATIGTIGQVYLDDETGEPEWVTTKSGMFSRSESFIPLADATADGADVRIPYSKETVDGAPSVSSGDHLSPAEEEELYRYYGVTTGRSVSSVETVHTDTAERAVEAPADDTAMTRSEEVLRTDTERVAVGRARLRKYVVTEEQTITVQVRREEVRLEHEPIAAGDALPTNAHDFSEVDYEVVLYEERAVVTLEAVPVERVRLATSTVVENHEVSGEVRKEQIELERTDTDGTVTRS